MPTNPTDPQTTTPEQAAIHQGTKAIRWLTAIPIVGDCLRIANAYTYDGARESDFQFAPIHLWVKKHGVAMIIAALFATISSPPECIGTFLSIQFPSAFAMTQEVKAQVPKAGALILNIFPNVLGFGIGVYALIFGLSSVLVQRLHQHLDANSNGQPGSVLLLNADMAYPLLVITLALGVAVLQQIFPQVRMLEALAWIALWYSLLMTLEILAVLFGLGENDLIEKLKTPPL